MDETTKPTSFIEQADTQMRKGMLTYCVLLLCEQGRAYSSDIIKELRAAQLIVVEGTLYPLLSRLAKDGILRYEWQESEQGPPRKYYWLTEQGIEIVSELRTKYHQLHAVVHHLEKAKDKEGTV